MTTVWIAGWPFLLRTHLTPNRALSPVARPTPAAVVAPTHQAAGVAGDT